MSVAGGGELSLHDRTTSLPHALEQTIAHARSAGACWLGLELLAAESAGHELFTFMKVHLVTDVTRQVYTSDPAAYPVSGTRPITPGRWFEIVHGREQTYVAGTLAEFATVSLGHAKIGLPRCGSVVNLPVVLEGKLAATNNMLHEAQFCTPGHMAALEGYPSIPSKLALPAARALS